MEPFHYATMLPQKDFSKPPPPVAPQTVRGLPKQFLGVPLFSSEDLKADMNTTASKAVIVESVAFQNGVANADNMEELELKYPDLQSMTGKKAAVVGRLPKMRTNGKEYVVVPPSIGANMGVGNIVFPFKHALAPPMLRSRPLVESATGGKWTEIWIVVGIAIFLVLLSVAISWYMQDKSEEDETVWQRLRRMGRRSSLARANTARALDMTNLERRYGTYRRAGGRNIPGLEEYNEYDQGTPTFR